MEKELEHALYLARLNQYEEAFPILEKYIEIDYPEIDFYLGYCFYYGKGTKEDKKKGLSFLEKAAQASNNEAINLLKEINENVEINKAYYSYLNKYGEYEALERLIKEATNKTKKIELINFLLKEEKDSYINFALARLYISINKMDKGYPYLLKAVEAKNEDASLYLAKIYEEGVLLTRDIEKAGHYYREAAYFDAIDKLKELALFYYRNNLYVDAYNVLKKIDIDESIFDMVIDIYKKLDKEDELISFLLLNGSSNKHVLYKLGEYYSSINKLEAFKYLKLAYDPFINDEELKMKIKELATPRKGEPPFDINEYILYIDNLLKENNVDVEDIKDDELKDLVIAICYRFGILRFPIDRVRSDEMLIDIKDEYSDYSSLASLFIDLFSINLHRFSPVHASEIVDSLEDNYINDIVKGLIYLSGLLNMHSLIKAKLYFENAYNKTHSKFVAILLKDIYYRLEGKKDNDVSLYLKKHYAYLDFFKNYYSYYDFKDYYLLKDIATNLLDYPPFVIKLPKYLDLELLKEDKETYLDELHTLKYPSYLLAKAYLYEKEEEYKEAIRVYEEAYYKYDIYEAMNDLVRLNKEKYDYSYLLYAFNSGSLSSLYCYAYNSIQEGLYNSKIIDSINLLYDMGVIEAGVLLGMLYIQGRGVSKDIKLGESLIKKALEEGSSIIYDNESGTIKLIEIVPIY